MQANWVDVRRVLGHRDFGPTKVLVVQQDGPRAAIPEGPSVAADFYNLAGRIGQPDFFDRAKEFGGTYGPLGITPVEARGADNTLVTGEVYEDWQVELSEVRRAVLGLLLLKGAISTEKQTDLVVAWLEAEYTEAGDTARLAISTVSLINAAGSRARVGWTVVGNTYPFELALVPHTLLGAIWTQVAKWAIDSRARRIILRLCEGCDRLLVSTGVREPGSSRGDIRTCSLRCRQRVWRRSR